MNPWDAPTAPAAEGDEADTPTRLGRFEIVRQLGAGGMGVVFEGRDATLERKVAIKLIRPGAASVAPARLLREAQALARLSHPNVVKVYEVGTFGDAPFIAMEMIEGSTLAEWLRTPRDWRAVLDLLIPVGRGLASVHELGLVHRDVKPSNVLLTSAGVPKLGDFGLVGASGEIVSGDASSALTDELTHTGAVMGTRGYMAPEQAQGAAVDARADQFAFGKVLEHAVAEAAPSALNAVIARTQQTEPDERYASMDALLAALERVRRGNRRWWIAAAAALVVAGGAALAWQLGRTQDSIDPCQAPTSRIARVWNPERSAALAQHLAAIDPALGAQRFAMAKQVFDRGAASWAEQNVQACQQADALLDRRMTCLDRALFELEQTVGLVAAATDPITLDAAMRAAGSLPTLDECADARALADKLPQPANPALRSAVTALEREIVDIDVMLRTGGTRTGAQARAEAAVARARSLGHAETLARALHSLALVHMDAEDHIATVSTLREAIREASTARDDRLVVELWGSTLGALASSKQKDLAATLLPAAEAARARITPPPELAAMYAENRANVQAVIGDVDAAKATLAQAVADLEAAGAAQLGSPLAQRLLAVKTRAAVMHSFTREWPAFVGGLRALVPLTEQVYGVDHPATAKLHYNIGIGLQMQRDFDAALVEMKRAAEITEARAAPSPSLASALQGVGAMLFSVERYTEAEDFYRRAVAVARVAYPADHLDRAGILGDYGAVLLELGRLDEARPLLVEYVATYDRVRPLGDLNWGRAVSNLGNLEFKAKNYAAAIPHLARAHPLLLAAGEKDHYDADDVLLLLAACHLKLDQWALAEEVTERILAQKDSVPAIRARTRFFRGGAWAGAGDPRGKPEVLAARRELVALGLTDYVAEVDVWLKRREIRP